MAKTTAPLFEADTEAQARALYSALNQNSDIFEQKIKIIKLRKVDGKEKVDKDNNPVLNEYGEPLRWDDSYYLTYVALNSGGEHTTRISQEQYLSLVENEVYVATGKIEYRLYKDTYNSVPTIVFNKFTSAIDSFVTAMLKFEQLKTSSQS
ncbi:hypothetical protein [Campylobacter sp. RM9328]|uniref:hypothetical protein n=1 Tax=Campylobacter sp. RM9328 TaxID=1705720 RepID=UPI00147374B9|nr:hypothetical protein [Campylobacter sp. RM9328]